ncbi:unnamed protein product [Cylindrotheca closterium]|uniref:Uncharacterized protein n=1 Tax=Cylindrotheca closterium TaxID=2856 RepID=A0AAD2G616_9STRA|nr:unnamed protein product [Cylindrotheca closterium]
MSNVTTTMRNKIKSTDGHLAEYSVVVPRGRPLFAAVSEQELKAGESIIVQRIVQDASPSAFKNTATAWLSVLGTRVQMGQTTFAAASGLVSRSYANLVSVSPATVDGNDKQSAKICFPPDPVCARLAMCLMDDSWSMALSKDTTLNGRPKVWWVQKMKDLFSDHFCSPEKGDFGEVMVALCFLFCADIVRGSLKDNKDYTTFSVPLNDWIKCLINRGRSGDDGDNGDDMMTQNNDCQVHFSAIQVCRNYARAYDDSWSLLQNEVFVENMYKTGVGFYVFAGCSVIDVVFALQISVAIEDSQLAPAAWFLP